jgi:AraC family transcriptional regulator of adaptative response / DNA-3-methyladenine glycosylase II
VIEDFEQCYRAVQSRDTRFDGWFYIGVSTTGIYCRPSCPAVTPKRLNVAFYPSAAACQAAGFRACRRCRPDAAPGSPQWNMRADVVGRAMRLIADGVVDREGVAGLARSLSYSERHLHRQLVAEVGAGPIALARSQRAQTARLLLETTDLPCSDIAFAAGFSSIRQFNDTIRTVFALAPTALRGIRRPEGRRRAPGAGAGATAGAGGAAGGLGRPAGLRGEICLRLPYREPFFGPGIFAFLGRRAVAGVEECHGDEFRRTLRLPNGAATVALAEGPGHMRCRLAMTDLRDLATAVARARRLLDLDADPVAVGEHLGADPLLAAAVDAAPGRRIPGAVDGAEIALRAVLGQQVSVAAARRMASALTEAWGEDLPGCPAAPPGERPPGPNRLFPTPAVIAELDPATLAMPRARAKALVGLAGALAAGRIVIDAGADREDVPRRLAALPGIGPWTAAYVALRGLGDPDAFLPSDLGVRRGLEALGQPSSPADANRLAQPWRPWRGYALQYLWAAQ